ncbi:EpsG family protein [Xenorhabdus koppenhoeferi]|uniref:EpsG family protein n=1 Tax=Xenorhabdus koppenhoeferi TaxID=351659 RepID=A0A1I7JNC7_9GAMM|nr:EpsG family protein [Xenorhabdus koppenhoeferi]
MIISEYTPNFLFIFSLTSLIITILTAGLKNKAISNSIALFLVIMYVVLFGLRDYSIGSDTEAYVDNFLYNNWDFEPLFTLITYVIKLFVNDPTIYLIILSLIYGVNIYLSYIVVGKNVKSYIIIFIWTILFSQGMLTGTINYFRQALGFSFLLLGFFLYLNKEKLSFLSCILIISSILIHNSNSILILLIFISRFIKVRWIIVVYFLSLIALSLDIGQTMINDYGEYHIIQRTLARHLYFNDRRSIETIYMYILLYSSQFLFFLYFRNKLEKKHLYGNLLKVYGLILSFSIFLSFNREMAIRYYIILQYIIPILYLYISTCIKQKMIFSILFASYTMLYFYYLLSRPWFTDQFLGNITQ